MRRGRRDLDVSQPRSLWGLDLSLCLQRLLKFRAERDWEQFHRPKELAAALAIEAGELQELFLWRDPETSQEVLRGDPARVQAVWEETADVLIYLLLLAHELGINLEDAVFNKIAVNEIRFPVNREQKDAG